MSADTGHGWLRGAIASAAMGVVLAASAATVASATPAGAQEPPTEAVTTTVAPTQGWTPTGVVLKAGDEVTITASGTISFGQGQISQMEPAGLSWGPECETIAGPSAQWLVPGLNCYSLVGRIGSGEPFNVGAGASIEAAVDGEVVLGTNDDNFSDNSGQWSAVVATPMSSEPAVTGDAEPAAKQDRGFITILLLGVPVVAVLVAFLWLRRRAPCQPAFDLVETLRAGRIDVSIRRDRTVWRTGDGGDEHPFVPFASDFGALGTEGRRDTFSWRGLDFRAERSGRFARPHGEVRMAGEYVAASTGMTLDQRGGTKGLLPLALAGTWVFTLVSVDTDNDEKRASADGHLTMFIRDDEPFREQADRIVASFRAFIDDLDRLLAEREAKEAAAARDEVTVAAE